MPVPLGSRNKLCPTCLHMKTPSLPGLLLFVLTVTLGAKDLPKAQELADRIYHTTQVFYCDPFGDMHNRMKEALVLLGRQDGPAVVRPPLMKLTKVEIARIAEAMTAAGIAKEGAIGLESPALAAE